jgi:iron complex outermembrane receptor protein
MKHGIRLQIFLILNFLLIFPSLTFSQNSLVHGTVTDETTGETMPFVNIGIKGESTGTFSDSNGLYQIQLSKGEYTLVISCVGYDRQERHLVCDGRSDILLNFEMSPTAQELSTVVVAGSKYEKNVEESISTIEVLKAQTITATNPTSIDKAIDKMPGIIIMDNEPQIRGGSGFSSGLGSRVMIMVDEIPVMRGDAGRPNWGFLPVDDVEQIELVKGASSVIYGSSAITGAINIRTSYPKDKPITRINTFLGIYSKPSRKYTTPWSGMNPIKYGISVSHLQKFDHIDVGLGANFYNDQGYILGTPEKIPDTAFNKGQFERRGKLYFNTRIRNKKIDGLTYGINGNIMYNESAETFFWFDADTNIYRSYPGALSHFKEFTFFVDPYIKYYNKNGNSHSLKNRIYYGNTVANNSQSNRFLTVFDEYQYTRNISKLGDLVVVAGLMSNFSYSYGQVFSGILAPDGTTTSTEPGTYTSENLGVYIQLERKFFKRLNVLLGGRWEYYYIAGYSENRPIFRAGANLRAGKATFFRLSVGQGYRAPSIAERYITTNSGGFGFYPNPDLQSETCLTGEFGAKQMFKIGKIYGMIDISNFYEEYRNYVEFNFGVWGNSVIDKSSGFKFLNTGPARIYGADLTIAAEGKLFRGIEISLLFGYTYTVPQATDPDLVYYQHYEKSIGKTRYYTYNNTSSDTIGDILKYRIQNLIKSDLQITIKKKISAGISGQYYGFMKNIDIFLEELDQPLAMHSGIVKYREKHHTGNFIVDLRCSYAMKHFRFSFLVNNVFNTEYSLRPITIESPRVTSLQVVMTI